MMDSFGSVYIPLSLVICIVFVLSGIGLKNYRDSTNSFAPHESSIAAILGLLVGGIMYTWTDTVLFFDSDLFMYLVLPPIIFSAGYSLKRKRFFRYGLSITVFGIVGTLVNFSITTICAYTYEYLFKSKVQNLQVTQAMLLASILSASDEVSAMALIRMKDYPRLGALIFGEGVINDAMSIVLFKALLPYATPGKHKARDFGTNAYSQEGISVLLGLSVIVIFQILSSLLIGLLCGLMNARFLKMFPQTRRHPIHQTSLVLLFGLLAYCIAESVGVSGILTLFVAAVTLAHYSWHSLSKSAQISTKLSLSAMSDIAEGFAFAYVGLSMWEFTSDSFDLTFSLYMLVTIIVARFSTILGLTWIFRQFNKEFDLPMSEQIGFSMGGVTRGCLCWAQAIQVNSNQILVTTTLFIVLTSTIASGFLFPVLLPMLIPKPTKAKTRPASLSISQQGPGVIAAYPTQSAVAAEGQNSPVMRFLSPHQRRSSYSTESSADSDDDSVVRTAAKARDTLHPDLPLSHHHDHTEHEPSSRLYPTHAEATVGMYSKSYVLWVRFDELVMKSLFGGSATAHARERLLRETQCMTAYDILFAPRRSRSSNSHSVDPRRVTGKHELRSPGAMTASADYTSPVRSAMPTTRQTSYVVSSSHPFLEDGSGLASITEDIKLQLSPTVNYTSINTHDEEVGEYKEIVEVGFDDIGEVDNASGGGNDDNIFAVKEHDYDDDEDGFDFDEAFIEALNQEDEEVLGTDFVDARTIDRQLPQSPHRKVRSPSPSSVLFFAPSSIRRKSRHSTPAQVHDEAMEASDESPERRRRRSDTVPSAKLRTTTEPTENASSMADRMFPI